MISRWLLGINIVTPPVYILFLLYLLVDTNISVGQSAMINIDARKTISLDGEWQAIPDPTNAGDWKRNLGGQKAS